jgi:tRNA dimethylallyltransferase
MKNSAQTKPVVLIAGPTASGKSRLALRLAELRNGVVINADALQMYADWRVLTARPSVWDEARAPHRLYGVLDAADSCSVAHWRDRTMVEIEAAWRSDMLPIVVGGTGLYLRTLLQGIAAVPEIPASVRARVRLFIDQNGPADAHDWLRQIDPVMADRLAPADRQRIARALEVMLATGCSLRAYQTQPTGGLADNPQAELTCQLLLPNRAEVYARCDARFRSMIDEGALDEARALSARSLARSLPAMKAVGAPELMRYVRGELDLDDAIAAGQQSTRRYAKRQFTWFRHQCADWKISNLMENDKLLDELVIKLHK